MPAGGRIRVLIPSAGGPGAVNLTRSLRAMDLSTYLVGLDASPCYLHLALTDVRLLGPRRSDPGYLAAVNAAVEAHSVDVIVPNNSLDGALLTRRRDDVRARTFLPSPEAFRTGQNKWESYQLFARCGLPVPLTRLLRAPGDLELVFQTTDSRPIWVRGAGIPGKGVGVASLPARTVQQAVQWVDFWEGWGHMIASEYLPGANLTWLGLWDRGNLVASQGRCRDAYVIPHVSPSGITGAPAISHTIHREDINQLGRKACLAVDPQFSGPAFVDFKEDAFDQPHITEINVGRFGTTHHFYSVAGANFPGLVVRLALGLDLPEWVKPCNVLPPDIYWIRTLDAGPVMVTRDQIDEVVARGRLED